MLNYEIRLASLFSAILYPCFLNKLFRRLAGENPECDFEDGDVPICSDFVDAIIFNPEIFVHSRIIVVSPETYALPFEIVQIDTKDGVSIMGYLILQQDFNYKTAPTIIFYHGNSGNIGDRLYCAKKFYRDMKVNILLVEYRGYGFSQGHASEQGVYRDAQAAFDYVTHRTDLDSSQIIVFGRSLGGAVAIDLATRSEYKDRIACLVLENTFASITELARHLLPNCLMPVVKIFRLTQKFANYKKIESVVRPTFFISGLEDALIPPAHMTKLYMRCKARKKIIRFRHGDHMNSWTISGYTQVFADFFQDSIKRFPVNKIPTTVVLHCKDEVI
ncbi:unnamed protein product [Allacma fusca]|uniref:Protein ABHD13 n=1 Tax=Allacma fusca TaxID=39272 RepID=A0A8J2PZG0_9HEXA|nr:unnamed protein product [Allacma fusca]